MNLFNKKRNKDEYLKYNNGKIESLGKKDSIPKDYCQIAYENEIKDNFIEDELISKYKIDTEKDNKNTQGNIDTKQKTSSILLKTGMVLMLMPILFVGYKAVSNYKINLNETLNELKNNANNNNANTNNTINNNTNPNGESNTNTNTNNSNNTSNNSAGTSNENVSINDLNAILVQIENINANIYKAYEATKTDVLNYSKGVNGINATTESLKTRNNRVLKNKQTIENMSSTFKKLGLEDVQNNILRRYDNLSSGLDKILLDMSKTRVISMLNDTIKDENNAVDKQKELIINYLNSNNIKFTQEDGKFIIE